jgi:hypothetical protein
MCAPANNRKNMIRYYMHTIISYRNYKHTFVLLDEKDFLPVASKMVENILIF